MSDSKTIIFNGKNKPFEEKTFELNQNISQDQVLVKITLSTVCGSDVHTWLGHRPFPTPCILGHEMVGKIISMGKNLTTDYTGQKLVIRHPQAFNDPDTGSFDIQTYTVIDPETEQETTLPEGLDLRANKLTGRPTTPGTYSITLRATDGGGLYVDHTFTFTVITRPGETVDPDKTTKKPKQVKNWTKVLETSFGNINLSEIYIPSFDCRWNFISSSNK